MRRFFLCAKFISARLLASASSTLSRFCSDLAISAIFSASSSVTARSRPLRFEKIRVGQNRREQDPKIFRAVNLVVGEFVNLLNRAVEIRFDDVAVKIADHEQAAD